MENVFYGRLKHVSTNLGQKSEVRLLVGVSDGPEKETRDSAVPLGSVPQ